MSQKSPYDFSKNLFPHWSIFHCYLDIPKMKHLKLIESRTKKMIQDGLVEEVKSLVFDQGFSGAEKPLKSIGYKEVIEFLDSQKKITLDQCNERIIISTRQLAKSQRTFFNNL